MKKQEIADFFKNNKTTILIASAIIAVVIVVWIVVRQVRKGTSSGQKDEAENLTGQTVTSGLNFNELSKRLFTAWISTWGTDEAEVYSILGQMQNQADWLYLQSRYQSYWSGLPWYERIIHTTAGLGLIGTLVSDMRRELSKKELQKCRDILTAKGITPGF